MCGIDAQSLAALCCCMGHATNLDIHSNNELPLVRVEYPNYIQQYGHLMFVGTCVDQQVLPQQPAACKPPVALPAPSGQGAMLVDASSGRLEWVQPSGASLLSSELFCVLT